LKLVGEDTEVDKTVIEHIGDPLVHIVRNAIDHGLESPEARREAGKPETGTVTIEARHEGGEVWIIISDDGRGLSREKILDKARSRGLVHGNGNDLRDEEVFKLVFEPGFSTAEKVTDISGRGVGMDVVKKNIEKLNGRVGVRSRPGQGSDFTLHIPLTLAIIDGMLVRVGDTQYAIPLLSIRESFRPTLRQITRRPDGQETVRVREEILPVLRLHEIFGKQPDTEDLCEGILVIVEADGEPVCLFVDELTGQQQTVIKGLSSYMGRVNGISGCTISGAGDVSLILDVGSLIRKAKETAAAMA
jgi:two-component system chemotaxis sensor kinase CheA